MPFMQGRMLASARGSMINIDPYRTAKYQYCLTKGNTGIFYAIVSADVRPDSNTSAINALWSA